MVQSIQTELDGIITQKGIRTVFQPIIDFNAGKVWGYEALSRGPADSCLQSPLALFDLAAQSGRLWDLERLCAKAAASNFSRQRLPGRLFVNVSYESLLKAVSINGRLLAALQDFNLKPQDVVIEITERSPTPDLNALIEASRYLHKQGFSIAIDDLGAGYSTLRLWSELKPDYVKIDRHFISDIDTDNIKSEFVRSIIEIARSMDSKVIAEGIETIGEKKLISAMGIHLMQGYYFQRPQAEPPSLDITPIVRSGSDKEQYLARNLVSTNDCVVPDEPITKVAKRFQSNSSVNSIAVVENGKAIGIVHRKTLLATLSKPFALDLYARKPIVSLIDENVLKVDVKLRLEQVSRMVTHRARFKAEEDFIISEDGQFVGIGQVIDLLRQITELQVKTARHANPLTMLPGNVPIGDCVDDLLCSGQAFTIVYFDLDNFKPFNDMYGYAKGDEVLVWFSGLLKKYCGSGNNFIGHVGGDDFIAVVSDASYREILKPLLVEFDQQIEQFYNPEDIEAGGIETEDRLGERRFFNLMSLSGGALYVRPGDYLHFKEVSYQLGKVKKQAKSFDKTAIVFDTGETLFIEDLSRQG
ncbi:hypothetical protein BTA51_27715 [Hahella sp. CCB-MM4]|uniref:GGDEF domain-containing protein n=1 Tax=Hahella sp. (strain CCB-MM4) TaxID=1926491 RepID=UPI000BCC76AE|nr:GGDEF domain-containing protein [Hahella sp. CCB-MM4]OZG70110.1 hypothetical protein BTA51_27715 [Hahella sp. CCB-MM4]